MKGLIVYFITAVIIACNSSDNKTSLQDTIRTHNSLLSGDTLPPMDTVPKGAKVYFKNLKEGESVSTPLNIDFGVTGINLKMTGINTVASGHHHLLIDAGDSIPSKMIIAEDSTHLHFDSAQTHTQIKLLPGRHKLALQYGDAFNRSYGEKLAKSVIVTVK